MKIFKIIVLVLYFFIGSLTVNSLYAKDLASWGAIGGKCSDMNEILLEFKDTGETVVQAAMQGFLSGLNAQLILDGKQKSIKVLNYNSLDFAFNYLKEYCRKEKDSSPMIGLLKYFDTLPRHKN